MASASLVLLLSASAHAMRVAVLGGSGNVGAHVCKELIRMGCDVASISRSGQQTLGPIGLDGTERPSLARFEGEDWVSKVEWLQADAATDALGPLLADCDACVSCIGSNGPELCKPQSTTWSMQKWSAQSHRHYACNYEPNAKAVSAAKAAGVRRFTLIGVWTVLDMAYGGTLPGIYTGKADAAAAAHAAFGDAFTYVGAHTVVATKGDVRRKALDSPLGRFALKVNGAIGKVRTFGEDYVATASFTPPLSASDLAATVAAASMGACEIAASERRAGMTTPADGSAGVESLITMRHLDGPDAIEAVAKEHVV